MNIKIFSKYLIMKVDTLILSGGGPSGIAYVGIFSALFEKKIIKKDLKGIKEIITTSAGIFFSFFLLLKIDIKIIFNLIDRFHISSILQNENISINDLLVDFGIYSNHKIKSMFQATIKNIYQKDDLTLQELYDLTSIKLTVKVFNVTLKQLEYISHQTDPTLTISTLAMMTTAIPFIFKPVRYKNYEYIDGGLRGHFPIEVCQSKDYLGIFIIGGSFPENHKIIQLFPIIKYIYSLMINQECVPDQSEHKKIIYNNINLGLDFEVTEQLYLKVIQMGYDNTMKFIHENLEK